MSDQLLKSTLSNQKKYLQEVNENKMSLMLEESKKNVEVSQSPKILFHST